MGIGTLAGGLKQRPSSRTGLTVNVVVSLTVLALSVYIGYRFKSTFAAILTGVICFALQLLVDLRLAVRDLVPAEDPLIAIYKQFQDDRCELFHQVAKQRYGEALHFFEDLTAGKIEVRSKRQIHDILSFLFTEARDLRRIVATSYGEMGEWTEADTWWVKKYLEDHQQAVKRGLHIERIFILDSPEQLQATRGAFQRNKEIGVNARYAMVKRIEGEDFADGGNCMLFYGNDQQLPLYALKATHENDEFVKAEIFRDTAHLSQFAALYSRIRKVSEPAENHGFKGTHA